mmetsp:Transcript_35411/g.69898  ORF Transcript_35411/g.69898 Transcript_35411/m.69898 type:complete len:218 (-) Transcript_35411:327-980(-)
MCHVRGNKERRSPVFIRRINVRLPLLHEDLHDIQVAPQGSSQEGSSPTALQPVRQTDCTPEPIPQTCRFDVRLACLHENPHDIRVALLRSHEERRRSVFSRKIDIHPSGAHEKLHNIRVASLRCHEEWSKPVLVPGIHRCPASYQQPHSLSKSLPGYGVKQGPFKFQKDCIQVCCTQPQEEQKVILLSRLSCRGCACKAVYRNRPEAPYVLQNHLPA